MPPVRSDSRRWVADVATLIAVGLMFVLLAMWMRSHVGGGHDAFLDGPGASLEFCSRDGWFMVGIGTRSAGGPGGGMFWRRRSTPLDNLINDPRQVFDITPFRFAVAVPHVLLAALLAVVPAWRWIYRERLERDRRRFEGLCRECGYDLRAAERGRCPECGTDIGATKISRPHANWRDEPPRPPPAPSGTSPDGKIDPRNEAA